MQLKLSPSEPTEQVRSYDWPVAGLGTPLRSAANIVLPVPCNLVEYVATLARFHTSAANAHEVLLPARIENPSGVTPQSPPT